MTGNKITRETPKGPLSCVSRSVSLTEILDELDDISLVQVKMPNGMAMEKCFKK